MKGLLPGVRTQGAVLTFEAAMTFPQLRTHKAVKILLDLAVCSAAYWLAFLIRFEGYVGKSDLEVMVLSWPALLLVKGVCLVAARVPRRSWRYVSLGDEAALFAALAAACGMLVVLRLSSDSSCEPVAATRWHRVPLGVLLIDLPLSFLALMGMRVGWGVWVQRPAHRAHRTGTGRKVPTLLVGAGRAGALVAEELATRPDLGIRAVGFLDDDPAKVGKTIHGVCVLGTTADLERVARKHRAEQALITIGGLPAADVRRIRRHCDNCGIATKIIPGIADVVAGRINFSTMREVSLEDLLHRAPVKLDNQAIAASIRSRRILITGAGGSIGSQLSREVCRFGPATLLLVEKAENGLFHLHLELAREFPHLQVVPYVADICDVPRMQSIFSRWKPHLVLHAAAHKHVPLMESNPGEAIKNNVLGTRFLADLADAHAVAGFVLISTDKAVKPTSVMGASKRVAELYLQALSQRSRTRFVTVRFGNVLGSNGSVIPIFKEQIARGGPLTITHPEMRRYFMTIPEASQLVLQAAAMGRGGELFILDMGEPVRIVDLAQDLIRLSGLAPEDVGIEFVGVRPGEKLFEELSFTEENVDKTSHPRIFIGRSNPPDWLTVTRQLEELEELALRGQTPHLLAFLQRIVPEYQGGGVLCLSAGKGPRAGDNGSPYPRHDVAETNAESERITPPEVFLQDGNPPALAGGVPSPQEAAAGRSSGLPGLNP